MGHLAECNRDVKVIHKLPGRKPKIFLGNARWRQDSVAAAPAASTGHGRDTRGQLNGRWRCDGRGAARRPAVQLKRSPPPAPGRAGGGL